MPVRISSSSAIQTDSEEITCLTISDLTRERLAEATLAHSAQHDGLTDLPNRTLLTDRIRHALERRRNESTILALLFCDVDGFKNINDAYGHQIGDDMLRIVAERLSTAVRPGDTVARIGGDEFVILCESLEDFNDAATIAYRASAAVAAPIATGPADLEMTVSIGVAVAAVGDEVTADTLLHDADEAMYKAKRQGPNVVELFDEQLRAAASSSLRLLAEMRRAEGDRELRLHYQPVIQLHNEAVIGVEALIRWQHPTRGLVQPDDFVPFAERSGLIVGIGAWVVHEACEQAAVWAAERQLPSSQLTISVNVSGRQLARRGRIASCSVARSRRVGRRADLACSRGHRERTDGRRRSGVASAHRTEDTRSTDRHRRLRHGLLVAGLPEAVSGRPTQDRSFVCGWSWAQPRGRGDRSKRDRPRTRTRHCDGR